MILTYKYRLCPTLLFNHPVIYVVGGLLILLGLFAVFFGGI